MKIVNIKTEYLHNPLGLDIIHPNISWTVIGEDIKYQKSFELIYKINNEEEIVVNKETRSIMKWKKN